MARELEALRHHKEEIGQKSTVSPSTNNETTFESPEYALEVSGTAVISEFGMKDQYKLDTFVIDQDTVIEIFRIFALLFYPHLPVLNPTISISAMHDTSPFLFWTIIAIVTSHAMLPQHAFLFEQLQEPFLATLRITILKAPVPLQAIQALTHLIVWPFTTERQNRDTSWLYCGVAINAAMYMGLHHSKPTQSYRSIGVPAGSLRARAHTWLGCFLASTSLGMHVGVPPSVNGTTELATIESFVRNYPIPSEFAYHIMVHHTLARFTKVVLENSQEVVSHSLVKLIDTELDALKTRYPTPWTPRAEMSVLIAKIHLYTMTIIRIQLDLTTREVLMKNGFSIALRIVYLIDQGGIAYRPTEYQHLTPGFLQRAIPKNYFRALVLATIFLVRFFALNINALPEEQEIARNHVAMAQRYLKSGSVSKGDEKERAAFLLERLSQQRPVDVDHTKLRIDDRMGASLVYDAITMGHELRNVSVEVEEESTEDHIPEPSTNANANADLQAPMPHTNMPALPMSAVPDMSQVDINDTNNIDNMDMFGGQMDFSLPEDLWGDSVWGMFGAFAPSGPGMYQ
ncbi:hypothetical protein P280DRAFT_492219 [Massarina eburnea CBS 473.64]|uniref:Xylanolytic transcriptional activator regulatory domain-containing protein n=1 Tax=Massarina eburnea CBS 473.64 TaxID=1395130 RepID=A0A6A6RS32_9PLEO|nr:hypothetical protein P280DRAFT_492219 [Massarina eburnea CBS 473.64]